MGEGKVSWLVGMKGGMMEQALLTTQAQLAETYGVVHLLFCPNAWALRHHFIHHGTGETIRARCNRWDCLYCGPRKVDQWRQMIQAAEPTLFLTLTKAGTTVEEAARALTTFLQYVRRGSKGRGPNHIGARLAYPVEYFGVLERHRNFAENGFHWHLLLRGVEHLPYKEIIQPAWRSARHGEAEIGHIEKIRKPQAIGYVTKYLTKNIVYAEKGTREKEREMLFLELDAQGNRHLERQSVLVEVESHARRIRYSRNFFPEQISDLRRRLFSDLEGTEVKEEGESTGAETPAEEEQPVQRSAWTLVEDAEMTTDRDEYKRRRQKALLDALEDIQAGRRRLSRRVLNTWAYQRRERNKKIVYGDDE